VDAGGEHQEVAGEALEDVREREEGDVTAGVGDDRRVALVGPRTESLPALRDVRPEVLVRERDALRLAGGAGGVDEAREVVGVAGVDPRLVRLAVVDVLSALVDVREREHVVVGDAVHGDDELQVEVVLDGADAFEFVGGFDDDADGLGVPEQVFDLP
jgi:hypothetical protein